MTPSITSQIQTKTIRGALERIAEIVGGKAWGADKAKPRIYMPSRRDCKAYFDFPDVLYPDSMSADEPIDGAVCCLGGACLKVFIDDCGQHPNWYKGQRAKIMQSMQTAALAVSAITHGGDAWVLIVRLDLGQRPKFDLHVNFPGARPPPAQPAGRYAAPVGPRTHSNAARANGAAGWCSGYPRQRTISYGAHWASSGP